MKKQVSIVASLMLCFCAFCGSAEDVDSWTDLELKERQNFIETISREEADSSAIFGTTFNAAKISVTDCDTWLKYILPYSPSLNSVAFNGSRWVVVGDSGRIYYSDDGLNWERSYIGVYDYFTHVRWFKFRFVAVGENGMIMTSSDGEDWSFQGSPTSEELRYLAVSSNRIVVVGRGGAIAWSSDGLNWAAAQSPTTEDIFCVEYFLGHFRLIADDGNVYDSSGGANWQYRVSLPSFPQYGSMLGMGKTSSMLIAVGYDVNLPDHGVIYTTPNGVSWQKVIPSSDTLRDVTYEAGKWVAVGDSTIIESQDGESWTAASCPLSGRIWDIAYGDGQFIGVGWEGIIRQTCEYSCTPPIIGSQPQSQTVQAGSRVILSVTAGGTGPFSYQWYEGQRGNTSMPISGATSRTYQTPFLNETTMYWVRVANACGSVASATATITISDCSPPVITSHPTSQTVQSGSSVTVQVAANGTEPFSYQWYEGNVGDTSQPISGAGDSSYTTPPLEDSTRFWVRVSNDCGQSNSNAATITVVSSDALDYWIPGMAHSNGANNTEWRSDVSVLNRSSNQASLNLSLYTNTQVYTASASIGPGDQMILEDIVLETFSTFGAGNLRVESTESVVVTARVFNEGVEGTFGQSFEGNSAADGLISGEEAILPFLTQNSSFRTNIGFSNMTEFLATVTVTLFLQNGNEIGSFDLNIPPRKWVQDNETLRIRFQRNNVSGCYARVQVSSGSGIFAYASVVDNETGDPTTVAMRR